MGTKDHSDGNLATIIMGVHPIYELLVSQDRVIERIHIARGLVNEKLRKVLDEVEVRGVPIQRESRQVLNKMSRGAVHQGIIAVIGPRSYWSLEQLVGRAGPSVAGTWEASLFVVLDGVQDPQNLGAVIRTAETAGASGVVVTDRHSAPLSAAVSRASAGALEHLPVARVTNLVSAIKYMKDKGIWIIGLDPKADVPWTAFDYSVPVALVLGGEHRGIRRLVRDNCDACVRLPIRGQIESLNVSVTAGIALYEVVRQRSGEVAKNGSSTNTSNIKESRS